MHNSSHSSKLDVKYLHELHFVLFHTHTDIHTIQTEIFFEASNATWNCEETYKLKSDNCVRYHSSFSYIVKRSVVKTERKARCVLEKHVKLHLKKKPKCQ